MRPKANRLFRLPTHWANIFVILSGGQELPGHALHEKGLQRQKGFGPLVSSQDERALLVPLMNRG